MCVAVKWDAFTSQETLEASNGPVSDIRLSLWTRRAHRECAVVESGELEACVMVIAADEERVGAGSYDHARGV